MKTLKDPETRRRTTNDRSEHMAEEPMPLEHPLQPAQIDAANRIYRWMPRWQRSDQALDALGRAMPGFTTEVVLLKAVAINSLYSTNVYAIIAMAEHLFGTLQRTDLASAGCELVDDLASRPSDRRRHISFASKFAHFFIDPARFPILDAAAESMVQFQLGPTQYHEAEGSRYQRFVAGFRTLVACAGWHGSTREFDRYLWIAGQYRAWCADRKHAINAELHAMFESDSPEVRSALRTLRGDN